MQLRGKNYYHIYHRGINKSDLFLTEPDYDHFLTKYKYYLFVAVETYAFCLIKNHIHLLVRVRSAEQQKSLVKKLKTKTTIELHGLNYSEFNVQSASKQFGHLFNSYTKYFNKKYERSGVLYDGRFKRIEVDSENYLTKLICYIHRNPIHHGITVEYTSYPHSSYNEIASREKSFINKRKVFEWMGGKENFKRIHQEFKKELGERYFLEK
jgi:REP element-mobilizing transposase RayT